MSLLEYLGLLATSNVLSFGNGILMVALLQRGLVEQTAMLTTEQLLYAFSIARVTPGQANLYVASVGYMLFGLPGAFLSIAAIALPSYVMIPLQGGYQRFKDNRYVFRFARGLACSGAGVVLAISWNLGRDAVTTPVGAIVVALTAVLLLGTKLPAYLGIIVATGVGIAAIVSGLFPLP